MNIDNKFLLNQKLSLFMNTQIIYDPKGGVEAQNEREKKPRRSWSD